MIARRFRANTLCASSTSRSSCSSAVTGCIARTSCTSAGATGARSSRTSASARSSTQPGELPLVTIQLAALQRGHGRGAPARCSRAHGLPARPPRDPGARRLDRRDAGARARRTSNALRDAGHSDVVYLHRTNRTGYKAGALDAGLEGRQGRAHRHLRRRLPPAARLPPRLVPHFRRSRKVGMVQTRWGHMNRDHSLLTKVQALMLDGHHLVENRARFAAGCLFNFSGTGGMWRTRGDRRRRRLAARHAHRRSRPFLPRAARRLEVRLPRGRRLARRAPRGRLRRSARSSSAGRRAPCRPSRKLMKRVMNVASSRSSQRVEAFFHLTPHFAYPLMVLL